MAVANPGRLWKMVAHCGTALLLQVAVRPAPGENTESAGEKPAETLRAELLAQRPLYRPDGPLRIRFTILNMSDQPVEIPLDQPLNVTEGIILPLPVVLGSGSQRALTVFFEDEEGKPVAPPAPAASGDGPRVLRLAPHGSVGTDIDLRAYVQSTRYAGSYRLEWRPLEGRLGTVSAQFRVEPRKEAILVTDYGKITFALDYDGAPRNVENFVELAGQGFYDGKTFHRVIPGYLAQGGCPKGDGTGIRADGKLVFAELRDVPVDIGTLLMAHKPSDVNSASCQFFIALARRPEWDNKYTVVGQARDEDSLRTLQQLAAQPTDRRDRPTSPLVIRSIKLVDADQERVRSLEPRAGRPTPTPPDAKASARDREQP